MGMFDSINTDFFNNLDPRAVSADPAGYQQWLAGAQQQEAAMPGSTMLASAIPQPQVMPQPQVLPPATGGGMGGVTPPAWAYGPQSAPAWGRQGMLPPQANPAALAALAARPNAPMGILGAPQSMQAAANFGSAPPAVMDQLRAMQQMPPQAFGGQMPPQAFGGGVPADMPTQAFGGQSMQAPAFSGQLPTQAAPQAQANFAAPQMPSQAGTMPPAFSQPIGGQAPAMSGAPTMSAPAQAGTGNRPAVSTRMF